MTGPAVFLALLAAALPPQFLPPGQDIPWEAMGEKQGVKLYRKEIPGSPLVAFRGEGLVEASPGKILTVLMDAERATEWVDRLDDSAILKHFGPMEHIRYSVIRTFPIIMKDRDFVSRVKVLVDRDGGRLILVYRAVEHALMPPRPPYVRGELINTRFLMTPVERGGRTWFEAEVLSDPRGAVPKWVVNFFQRSWPLNTIEGLRAQVAKPGVTEDPHYSGLLVPASFPGLSGR